MSLTVAKIANIGLGIAGCFFPGIPTIPDDVLAKGDDILAGLDHKSSAEDFACIQGALDAKATNGESDDFQKQVSHMCQAVDAMMCLKSECWWPIKYCEDLLLRVKQNTR